MRRMMLLTAAGAALAGCTAQAPAANNAVVANDAEVSAPANVVEVGPAANAVEPVNAVEAATPGAALPDELTDAIKSGHSDLAVTCAALLGHGINAAPRSEWPALRKAMDAWRAELAHAMFKDDSDQYFASTFAVLRDVPADRLKAGVDYCVAHVPTGK